MNLFTPAEIATNYAQTGVAKATAPLIKLILMGVLAGAIIGLGGAVSSTATATLENASAARVVSGLLFPFGLGVVMIMGLELYTGNTMIVISVLTKLTTVPMMLRNWVVVYFANLVGGMLVAAGCVYAGQVGGLGDALVLKTIKTAVAKCSINFGPGVVLGILCNLLVCFGVLMAFSAKDTTGRAVGAFLPVAFFIICGFEHCVANMYYVPAGIFAMMNPTYAELAASAGIHTEMLTWGNFFLRNLVPVTIGNIIGGSGLGVCYWACYLRKGAAH